MLIPDFQGDRPALLTVLAARPDVLNHNIESVPRLYPQVRPQADYLRSLALLKRAREFDSGIATKSGLMLGLGEEAPEVRRTLQDLRAADCRILTAHVRAGDGLCRSRQRPLRAQLVPRARKLPGAQALNA